MTMPELMNEAFSVKATSVTKILKHDREPHDIFFDVRHAANFIVTDKHTDEYTRMQRDYRTLRAYEHQGLVVETLHCGVL